MGLGSISLYSPAGPILLILALLSVLSIYVIVEKVVELRGITSGASERVAAIGDWRDGERERAESAIVAGRSPADRVTLAAMRLAAGGATADEIEALATRIGNEEIERMHRRIRFLEVTAVVSPLLGLLGTVLGMIESFQQLQLAGSAANASVLAGGIWQALTTTAAGLIVAIPATLAAHLLTARIDRARHMIEDAVARLTEPADKMVAA